MLIMMAKLNYDGAFNRWRWWCVWRPDGGAALMSGAIGCVPGGSGAWDGRCAGRCRVARADLLQR